MQTPPVESPTEFVPVAGGGESVPGGTLLVVAYLAMWALLFGYVLLTWQRQRRLELRLAALEAEHARRQAEARPCDDASERHDSAT